MNKQEAAEIFEGIINSLKESPNQFILNVIIAGMSAHGSNGGIGAVGIAQGGGVGIMASASVDNAKIEIMKNNIPGAMDEKIKSLVDTLSNMLEEIRKEKPDKNILTRVYRSLLGTWVPGVITSIIGNLITMVFK